VFGPGRTTPIAALLRDGPRNLINCPSRAPAREINRPALATFFPTSVFLRPEEGGLAVGVPHLLGRRSVWRRIKSIFRRVPGPREASGKQCRGPG